MHVLTVYAHPNPKSFCHAVLEQFNEGLREAGHTNEVLDLYALIRPTIVCQRQGTASPSAERRSSAGVQQISSQSSIFASCKDWTTIRLSTWAIPGEFAAARSAESRCNQVPTVPVSVAVSPDTVTVM